MATIPLGSTVRVQLFDGRIVIGTVLAVVDTVAGRKVRVKSGDRIVTVDAEQVIESKDRES